MVANILSIGSNTDFREEVDSILSAELTPEIIDTYVDSALQSLIGLAIRASDAYVQETGDLPENNRELEDRAFHHYGLSGIPRILVDLSSKSESIEKLRTFVDSLEIDTEVVVPPDETDLRPRRKSEVPDNPFEERGTIARLETILFVLQNDFNVDVFDRSVVGIIRGSATPEGVRHTGYDFIHIPKLDRVILSCDEKENATFIFAPSVLGANGITVDQLKGLTKSQLRGLIERFPGSGQRITYSSNFVTNVTGSLREALVNGVSDGDKSEVASSYLYPKPPQGVLSTSGFSKSLGLSNPNLVKTAITALGDSLGPVNKYRFSNEAVAGYTEEQQEMIFGYLESAGYLDQIPVGVMSVPEIAESFRAAGFSLGDETIRRVAEELGESLGDVGSYFFATTLTKGYTEEQRWRILAELYNRNSIGFIPTDGILSTKQTAHELGVTWPALNKAVASLGEQIGSLKKYKFGANVSVGFDPAQQNLIKDELERTGFFVEKAPEGALSFTPLARSLKVADATLELALVKLSDRLGKTKVYRFGPRRVVGYTLEQQRMIRDYLDLR